MKKFRKNEQGLFACEECHLLCKSIKGLSRHINLNHNGVEKYFDKWIKDEKDGFCKICNEETTFYNFALGYRNCCCKECTNKYNFIRTQKSCIEKYGEVLGFGTEYFKKKAKQTFIDNYGVENISQSEEIKKKKEETCFAHFGVTSSFKSQKIRNKGKQTKKEKYGDENYCNAEKAKQTCLNKYGAEYPFQNKKMQEKLKQIFINKYGIENPGQIEEVKEKIKQTCLNKYGTEYNWQSEEIKDKSKQTKKEKYGDENYTNRQKSKQTCLNKYGVEYPNQNKDILEKSLKSVFKLKQFRDTNVWYQGSYELDFLEKYFDLFPDIKRGPSIKYKYQGKNKVYLPDFYIPSLNFIIECKNSYLAKRDKEGLEAKKKATIANGFNYVMIVDKNYTEFDKSVLIVLPNLRQILPFERS